MKIYCFLQYYESVVTIRSGSRVPPHSHSPPTYKGIIHVIAPQKSHMNGYPPPPPVPPRKCERVWQPYSGCRHRIEQYAHCGGVHQNEFFANKACHEARTLPPALTRHAPSNPGYCEPKCRANGQGWLCCQCAMVYNPTTVLYEPRAPICDRSLS